MNKVIISLGSNTGDKLTYINSTVSELGFIPEFRILKISSLMCTSPVGVKEQDDFYNLILLSETSLSAFNLLDIFKKLEIKLGRQQRGHWREREIDIDILFYENFTVDTPELIIPHKEYKNRLFILEGCVQVCPDFFVSGENKTILDIYRENKNRLHGQSILWLDTKLLGVENLNI